jgi:hypothetical protein
MHLKADREAGELDDPVTGNSTMMCHKERTESVSIDFLSPKLDVNVPHVNQITHLWNQRTKVDNKM